MAYGIKIMRNKKDTAYAKVLEIYGHLVASIGASETCRCQVEIRQASRTVEGAHPLTHLFSLFP